MFNKRSMTFAIWVVTSLAIIMIAFVTLVRVAKAETCARKVDSNVERKAGYKWQWRTIDGKQCWYYSNNILPREDLVWSYTTEEFDSDVDRVVERKFYIFENGEMIVWETER